MGGVSCVPGVMLSVCAVAQGQTSFWSSVGCNIMVLSRANVATLRYATASRKAAQERQQKHFRGSCNCNNGARSAGPGCHRAESQQDQWAALCAACIVTRRAGM